MPAMLSWLRPHAEQADIDVPARADVNELLHAVRRAENGHIHADWWPLDHYLSLGPNVVATHRGSVVGVLAFPSDPPPAAWVRALAIADGWQPRAMCERLIAAAVERLAASGASDLAIMHAEPWLQRLLPDLDMRVLTEVVTWRTHELAAAPAGHAGVHVRPARPDDVPVLAEAEAAAFEPLWRLSRATLERMLSLASAFTVAELDGQFAGYQFSSLYSDYGHLVRITVRPELQGRGIGTALISDLFRRSAARGIATMTLNTQQDNRTAQRVYTRFGFRMTHESTPVWSRRLTPNPRS